MKENLFKLQIGDVRFSVTLFDEAFRIKKPIDATGELSMMRTVHRHSAYEIFFVLDGSLTIVTGDRTEFFGNTVVIVSPYFDHYSVSKAARGYCMYFSVDPVGDPHGRFFREVTDALREGLTVLSLGKEEDFYLARLAEIYEGGRPEEDAEPLLTLLFSALFRAIRPKDARSDRQSVKYGQYINTIDLFLSEHYREPIRISDLADALFLCPKQIARIIRKEYGCSFTELVCLKRLTAACMLLKYSDLEISEIASGVGYSYENYFYTQFRKRYGVTPGTYRAQSRMKGPLSYKKGRAK